MDFSQDFNPHWTRNVIKFNHDESIPSHFRCIVVGSSGSGKTFRIFNMLLRPDYLDYDALHIYSPTLYQDEYKMLIAGLKNKLSKLDIINCFSNQDKIHSDPEIAAQEYAKAIPDNEKWHDIQVHTYGDEVGKNKLLPQPDDLEKGRKHLIVFDDCMTGPQKQIENYFTRGRHNNCNVIYIAQNWFELPNKTIRGNCNLILLFPTIPQDRLKRFYNEVIAPSQFQLENKPSRLLSQEDFVNHCFETWNVPYHYVTINKETRIVT